MTRRPRLAPFLLTLAFLGSSLPGHAQPAFLVKDIRTGEIQAEWPSGTQFAELGGVVYFRAFDHVHGSELWRTDGTAGGTTLVRDICPGFCSSSPFELTVAGSTIFFRADDGAHGAALWKSDGTKAGTLLVEVVEPFNLAEAGGTLFFAASSPEQGTELWKSDGTAAGTVSLGDLRPGPEGSFPSPLGPLDDVLLFAADDGEHGRELWKSDGTAAETALVEDITPGPDSSFSTQPSLKASPAVGGRLLFWAGGLWASDGTSAGTERIGDVISFVGTFSSKALDGAVYFSGFDGEHRGLWKSDGSASGTVLVKEIPEFLDELTVAGNRLFFRSDTGFSPSATLWVSDSTEAGTGPVTLPPGLIVRPFTSTFLALGDELIFYGDRMDTGMEPWKTDGTEAGTILLGDVYPGQSSSLSSELGVVVGGLWLFRANTPDGWELWKSDGAPGGTQLLEKIDSSDASGLAPEIAPASFGSPFRADLAGVLLLSANGSSPGELWRSDGTEAGTSLVKGMPFGSPFDLTPFAGKVFFGAGGLWSSDGTEAGTTSFQIGSAHNLTLAGTHLYFISPGLADALVKIGPSDSEPTVVKSVFPGVMESLTAVGSRLFFSAVGSSLGQELWTSDGTEAGTQPVDIAPGAASSSPRDLTAHRGRLFFSADDGANGRELWLSNGTAAGTQRIDIVPGPGSANPRSLASTPSFLFFVAEDDAAGAELWKSDGTAAGTQRVKDIRPGPEPSFIQWVTAVGERIYFAAADGVHGVELWVSDGTAAGTYLVKDAIPGAASSYPRHLTAAGHLLIFAADDGTHGLEPWKSDGTAAGTAMIQDLAPGEAPSTPTSFALSGDYLYFTANDNAHGFELWARDRAGLGGFLAASKRVIGPAYEGAIVIWEVIVTNVGAGPHPDNPGDELVDIVPAPLSLVSASANAGTAAVDLAQNRVSWNGALDPGESVTITIRASVPSSVQGQTFFNQATLSFDADGDGTNESSAVSDDPGRAGSAEATPLVISSAPLDFHTVTPCRVLDTRASAPLSSGTVRTISFGGTCGIPASAQAVAANLTVLAATGNGHVTLYPSGSSVPSTSNVNFSAGQTRANNAMLGLAAGEADARAFVVGSGTVHLLVDVSGYYE